MARTWFAFGLPSKTGCDTTVGVGGATTACVEETQPMEGNAAAHRSQRKGAARVAARGSRDENGRI
jgi:hypothetical protein